jgi:hypothetical protein
LIAQKAPGNFFGDGKCSLLMMFPDVTETDAGGFVSNERNKFSDAYEVHYIRSMCTEQSEVLFSFA